MITKNELTGGIKNTKLVKLPMYDDAEIAIREISDFEYNKFISDYKDVGTFDMTSLLRGNDIANKEDTTKFKSSMSKLEKNRFNAKAELVAKSLSNEENGETYKAKDVEGFRAGTIDLLVKEILNFSGLENPEELEKDVENFRKE